MLFAGGKLPEDWDRPSEHNSELCRLFQAGVFRIDGRKLNYRYFVPSVNGNHPLVIYLHGADAVGEDNETHLAIHDIGTMFARPDWQKEHPCYILAPQCGRGMHWSGPGMAELVQKLVLSFLREYRSADEARVYIYGYSAGGAGLLGLLKRNPGFYAGAVPICGATSGKGIEYLNGIPLWMVHAEDDQIVRISYGKGSPGEHRHFGSRDLYFWLKEQGAEDVHYTEYPAGFMEEHCGVNPHCSWVMVSGKEGTEIREWLFRRRK